MYKRSDGIFKIITADNLNFTDKEAKGISDAVLAFAGRVPRSYAASEEAMRYTTATAVVIKSWPQRVIGNIILSVDKPPKPFKLFGNAKEPIEWLEEQIR